MVLHEIYLSSLNNYLCSLRSRRSKGNGEGIRARDCAQGKREEGGGRRGTPARKLLFSLIKK